MNGFANKPWGNCCPIALSHICQYDKLFIFKDGYSSLHFHRKKHNQFVVESGTLVIYELDPFEKPFFHRFEIHPGETHIIEPGPKKVHQFFAPEDCVMHEFYWQRPEKEPLDREEIVRLTENGRGEFVAPTWERYEKLIRKHWS